MPDRPGTAKSERTEWAQGFLLDYQSGFTPGTVGFGVDALGLLGVKLDSGRGRSGTGLLPVHDDGRAADEFASLGMTAKARLAKTTRQVRHLAAQDTGTDLQRCATDCRKPTKAHRSVASTSRTSALTGGHLDRFKLRDSTDSMPIVPDGYRGDKIRDFSYAGAEYKLGKAFA